MYNSNNILKTIINREKGSFSLRGKNFDFIPTVYYLWFKETSPRKIVIDRNPKNFDDYQAVEWKFHPNCRNGC